MTAPARPEVARATAKTEPAKRPQPATAPPDCTPDESWRKGAVEVLQELAEKAAHQSVKTGLWFESQELALSEQIRAASTPVQCAAVERRFVTLSRELKTQ
jgi:hypothetical protein